MLPSWSMWWSNSNLQHLLQKVDISSGTLRAVLQGLPPQFLAHFRMVCCLLEGRENNVVRKIYKVEKKFSHWDVKDKHRSQHWSENVRLYCVRALKHPSYIVLIVNNVYYLVLITNQVAYKNSHSHGFVWNAIIFKSIAYNALSSAYFCLVISALRSLKDILTDVLLYDFEKWLSHYQRGQP